MFDSLTTLAASQSVRRSGFPLQLAMPSPLAEWVLESPRERNATLDAWFYDVGCLSQAEAGALAPRYAAEGAILEVGPKEAPSLRIWRNRVDFTDGARDYAALVVAGVGSSALGAAAFARNVASAAGAPVLAVVSGYGLSDMVTEAIGGWYLFGALNSARHWFEWLDDVRLGREPPIAWEQAGFTAGSRESVELVRRSEDVRTLIALLSGPTRFRWLVGHSKGNLVISEALYALRDDDRPAFDRLCAATGIVTVGAKITMPRGMTPIVDVMGALDAFGEMNSRTAIATDVLVPDAGHHTNTEIPLHLPVASTLAPIFAGNVPGAGV